MAWVHDAFQHLKVIGATAAAQPLLDAAGVAPDTGILTDPAPAAYIETVANGRIYAREPSVKTIF